MRYLSITLVNSSLSSDKGSESRALTVEIKENTLKLLAKIREVSRFGQD